MEQSAWITVLQACIPIVVAIVGIVPTIISNRKKTQKSLDDLQNTLNAHIKEDEAQTAKNKRYRILRFYDELCAGVEHSESHFEDILDDIDDYTKYCNAHEGEFKNHRGKAAMDYIQAVYRKLKESGKFLTHQ